MKDGTKLKKLEKLLKKRQAEVLVALEQGAILVESTAKKMVQKGPASGAIRSDGSQASAPGEAPMADKGILAGGIVTDINLKTAEAFVISRAAYSKALEYGTKNMEPRPYMVPALEKNQKAILKKVVAALGGKSGN